MKPDQKQSPLPHMSRPYTFRNHQRGVATVLLVILLGIAVMVMTATLVRSINSKKEATVAAHAQTNAQMMAWAGVSAFRQYLIQQGKLGVSRIKIDLPAKQMIVFRTAPNEVAVQNISVTGPCAVNNDLCIVKADISANNTSAKAANTINVVFQMKVKDGIVQLGQQKSTMSFGGNTTFSGNVVIEAATPDSEITLNSDGNIKILSQGLITKNISVLNIKSSGDVYIDCAITNCGNSTINVTAKGTVFLANGANFGTVQALGDVSLAVGAYAKDITTQGRVTMTGWSRATSISAGDKVNLNQTTITGNVESKKRIIVSDSKIGGDVKSYEYVEINTNAKIDGSVYGRGDAKFSGDVAVSHSASTVNGNVYTNKDLYLWGFGSINGQVYATGRVRGIADYVMKGGYRENMSSIPELNFIINKPDALTETIKTETQFLNNVDVRVYKNDANYIFTAENQDKRVYLNQLKNKATGNTYIYENNAQYFIDQNNVKSKINDTGFELGLYKLNGEWLTGAICQTVDVNRHCTSDIVGYLPRISVGTTLGINDAIGYGELLKVWRIRSLKNSSGIDNAVLAPGVMYFEGHLEVAGNANWSADSQTSAYVNAFLAEGQITPLAFSPTVYSPYEVVRGGTPDLVCNRTLKDVNGVPLNINNTTPRTLSDKYLVPVNLCKDDNTFARTMDKNPDGSRKTVTIDGKTIPKIDLGNVAFMSNIEVNIGACSRVFGDVLARLEANFSAACGITSVKNSITGNVTTQGKVNSGVASNDILGGTHLIMPYPSVATTTTTTTGPTGTVIDVDSIKLVWAKLL